MRVKTALTWVAVALAIWLAIQYPQIAGDVTSVAGHLLATAYTGFLRILRGL